jgi:hypothetical protein
LSSFPFFGTNIRTQSAHFEVLLLFLEWFEVFQIVSPIYWLYCEVWLASAVLDARRFTNWVINLVWLWAQTVKILWILS